MIFDPPLPETTTHVLKRMPAGRITKIIATYSTVSEIMTLHQRYYNISGHPIFTPSQHPHCTSAPFYTPRPTSSPYGFILSLPSTSIPTLYSYAPTLYPIFRLKAFWRSCGYSGSVVTNGGTLVDHDGQVTRGPLCLIYDATTATGNPALVAFIGGQQHLEHSSKTVGYISPPHHPNWLTTPIQYANHAHSTR